MSIEPGLLEGHSEGHIRRLPDDHRGGQENRDGGYRRFPQGGAEGGRLSLTRDCVCGTCRSRLRGQRARIRASVARFIASQAFSAASRIRPGATISSASAWSSRASWKIASMGFVLFVVALFYSGPFSPARMGRFGPFPGGYDLIRASSWT